MFALPIHAPLTARLVDALYTEAMLLADETRSYFDGPGQGVRALMDPAGRVGFACESLNATTRLMQVIAWLLVRRAIDAGEMEEAEAGHPSRQLGIAPPLEVFALERLPIDAKRLVEAGVDLHNRVRRLAEGAPIGTPLPSPARSLLERLERAF